MNTNEKLVECIKNLRKKYNKVDAWSKHKNREHSLDELLAINHIESADVHVGITPFKNVDICFFVFPFEDCVGWNENMDSEEFKSTGKEFKRKIRSSQEFMDAVEWVIDQYRQEQQKFYDEHWKGLMQDAGDTEEEAKNGAFTKMIFPEWFMKEVGLKA